MLAVNEEIAALIVEGASHGDLQKAAERGGMVPIHEDGLRRCLEGVTSPDEITRAVFLHD